uniref:(northern house mosquito) hypothetical protein n=1 Tax=Culex pipiens TaxID=7175 RepID=A0A8D8JJ39_CULPI
MLTMVTYSYSHSHIHSLTHTCTISYYILFSLFNLIWLQELALAPPQLCVPSFVCASIRARRPTFKGPLSPGSPPDGLSHRRRSWRQRPSGWQVAATFGLRQCQQQ